jgi:hypothetical protein
MIKSNGCGKASANFSSSASYQENHTNQDAMTSHRSVAFNTEGVNTLANFNQFHGYDQSPGSNQPSQHVSNVSESLVSYSIPDTIIMNTPVTHPATFPNLIDTFSTDFQYGSNTQQPFDMSDIPLDQTFADFRMANQRGETFGFSAGYEDAIGLEEEIFPHFSEQ